MRTKSTKRERILALFSQGKSNEEISESVGCHREYVQRLRKNPNYFTHSRRPKHAQTPALIPLASSSPDSKEVLIALIGSPKQVLEAVRQWQ